MNYVMSDIHGKYDRFTKALELVNFSDEDKLYILGDIVDRGEDPIKLIKHIMSSDNIKMCLGNHEDLMIDAYNEGEITEEKIDYALAYWEASDKHLDLSGFNIIDMLALTQWIGNGGAVTAKQFIKLSKEEQEEIICFFENLPLYFEHKYYILSHAGMSMRGPKDTSWKEIKKFQRKRDFIWSRQEFYEYKGPNDKFVIFGHTPAINGKLDIWVDPVYQDKMCIDCGAAYGGYLACVNLNTQEIIYV